MTVELGIPEERHRETGERPRVEETPRTSQQQYESLVQSIDGIVWEVEAQTFRFTFVSQQAERILGYPLEQWLNQPNFWADHVHPDDRAWAIDLCVAATARKEDHQFDYRMIAADGRVVWLRDIVTVCVMEDQSVRLRGVMVDITERKCVEEAQRASEERFRTIFKSAGVGMALVGTDARLLECNPALLAMLGYSAEELCGKIFTEITHPDDWRLDWELYQEMLEGKRESYQIEKRYYRKDGSLVWGKLTASFVRDAEGRPLFGVGMVEDITRRKQAELELRTSEERYRSLVVATAQAVWLTNAVGQVVTDSPSWRGLTGQTEEEMKGQGWLKALHPEDRERTAQIWARAVETQSLYETIYRIRTAAGVYRDFYVRGVPVIDEAGTIRDWVGTCTDITERKRAEHALRESESRWRTIFENAAVGISLLDAEGRPVQNNPALQRMLGYTEEELCRMPFTEFTHPEDVDLDVSLYQELIEGKRDHYQMEKRYIRKDGQVVWGNLIVSLIRDEHGSGQFVVGMAEDITERKRAGQALQRTEELFRAIVEDQTEMIVRWKPDGTRTFVNQAYCRTFGKSFSELVGTSFLPLIAEPYREAILQKIQSITPSTPLAFDMHESLLPNGAKCWQEWTDRGLFDEQGRLIELQSVGRDITERKRAEQALRASEELFSKAFNLSPLRMGIARIKDGVILDVSDRWVQDTGFTREEIIGHPVFELKKWIGEEEQPKIQQLLAEGKPVHDLETRLSTKTGEQRVTLSSFEVIELSGEPCFLWAANDITERKRAEETVRESEARFRQLTENIREVFWMNKPDLSEVLYISPAYETVWGRTCESLRQNPRSFLDAIHPEDRPQVIKIFEQQVACGFETEYRVVRPDGSIRWIWDRGFPIKDEADQFYLIAGIAEDITEHKRAEEALRFSESRYRKIVEVAPEAIVVADMATGKFVDFNPQALALFKLSATEIIEVGPVEMSPPFQPDGRPSSEAVVANLRQALAGETPVFEWLHRNACGADIPCEVRLLQLPDESRFLVRGTITDISERKQAEQQLKATSEQLRALTASLSSAREEEGTRIAREIHDELGSLLTSLRWELESFDKVISKSKGQSQFQVLREKVAAMLKLTDTTIGTVRRIASELRPSVLDDLGLPEAIEWQAQEFQAHTGILCQCDCLLENLALSREQATALFRIFQETLTNILRHAQATRVDITMEERADEFVLTVRDNGKGITEEQQSAPQSLGLLGMRERAHLVGGEIQLTGIAGKGTVVRVQVPITAQRLQEEP